MGLAVEEFLLDPKDMPLWDALPSEREIKKECKLHTISSGVSLEGRRFKDPDDDAFVSREQLLLHKGFTLTDQDLLCIEHAVDKPQMRASLLESVDPERVPEILPPARLFNLRNYIEQKKKEAGGNGDIVYKDRITTAELFAIFREIGVRPGNLKELLAYAKARWKPEITSNGSPSEEERAQHADAQNIFAIGSLCSNGNGGRKMLFLQYHNLNDLWNADGKCLQAGGGDGGLSYHWKMHDYFLVFRDEE